MAISISRTTNRRLARSERATQRYNSTAFQQLTSAEAWRISASLPRTSSIAPESTSVRRASRRWSRSSRYRCRTDQKAKARTKSRLHRQLSGGLNGGLFVGFTASSASVLANEENPLVYADPATGEYFHFISNDVDVIGHPDGLIATASPLRFRSLGRQHVLCQRDGRYRSDHVLARARARWRCSRQPS